VGAGVGIEEEDRQTKPSNTDHWDPHDIHAPFKTSGKHFISKINFFSKFYYRCVEKKNNW
jgi:hypothetical protein